MRDNLSVVKNRNTIQRNVIFSAVGALCNHPSADDVYAFVTKTHPDISKATVYRNLNVLSEQGKIFKITVANGADRFDHNTHLHYHIKCTCCNSFGDIDLAYLPSLDTDAQKISGYKLKSHNIVFEGVCPMCQKN